MSMTTECLAYTDITVEVSQQQDAFLLSLQADDTVSIRLILNYLQVKTLADALLALACRGKLQDFLDTKYDFLFGDIRVKLDIGEEEAGGEGEKACRPNTSSARMVLRYLLKLV